MNYTPILPYMEREEILMLFTEQELSLKISDPFSILGESVYLTEKEATIYPSMVPIVENNRLQAYVVDFNGIRQLSESSGLNYLDSIVAVAESDGVALDQVCVAIDEADLIESPELANNLGAIVVRPLSELDDEFQFCLEAVSAFMETEDEEFLDLLSEEGIKSQQDAYYDDYFQTLPTKQTHYSRDRNDDLKGYYRVSAAHNRLVRYLRKKHGVYEGDAKDLYHLAYLDDLKEYKREKARLEALKKAQAQKSSTSIGSSFNTGNPESKPKQEPPKPTSGGNVPPPKSGSGGSSSTALVPVKRSGGGNVPPPKSGSGGSLVPKSGAGSNGGGNVPLLPPGSGAGSGGSNGMSFGKKAAIGAGIAAAIGGGILAYNHYRNKPKSVIAKRIAALRSIYQKWMAKASSSKDSGLAAKLRRVAAKILQVIDKLMSFLQRKADGR